MWLTITTLIVAMIVISMSIAVVRWKVIKWSAGLLGLYLDWRLNNQKRIWPIDVYIINLIMGCLITKPVTKPFTNSIRRKYDDTVRATVYWHGTGRFQYDRQGSVIDVFSQILDNGGLKPHKDIFDIKEGEMYSTSVTKHRMYARIYGDIHEYMGADLRARYGSPRFWAYYYIMVINFYATKEMGLWNTKARRAQHETWRKQGKDIWAKKVRQNLITARSTFFNEGSDIIRNYPIIIGIKYADFNTLKTADYVTRYETRISSKIPLDLFTHIETTREKVAEIEALLKRYHYSHIPVFALEQCEKLYAQKKFTDAAY